MAQKPEIQYIHQYYTYGSEARVTAPAPGRAPHRAKTTLPKAAPKKEIRLQVDPVALFSLLVAAVMLVLMAGILALMIWGFTISPEEAPPLWLVIILAAIPLAVIVGVLLALVQRLKQIKGGEEDAASQY